MNRERTLTCHTVYLYMIVYYYFILYILSIIILFKCNLAITSMETIGYFFFVILLVPKAKRAILRAIHRLCIILLYLYINT